MIFLFALYLQGAQWGQTKYVTHELPSAVTQEPIYDTPKKVKSKKKYTNKKYSANIHTQVYTNIFTLFVHDETELNSES